MFGRQDRKSRRGAWSGDPEAGFGQDAEQFIQSSTAAWSFGGLPPREEGSEAEQGHGDNFVQPGMDQRRQRMSMAPELQPRRRETPVTSDQEQRGQSNMMTQEQASRRRQQTPVSVSSTEPSPHNFSSKRAGSPPTLQNYPSKRHQSYNSPGMMPPPRSTSRASKQRVRDDSYDMPNYLQQNNEWEPSASQYHRTQASSRSRANEFPSQSSLLKNEWTQNDYPTNASRRSSSQYPDSQGERRRLNTTLPNEQDHDDLPLQRPRQPLQAQYQNSRGDFHSSAPRQAQPSNELFNRSQSRPPSRTAESHVYHYDPKEDSVDEDAYDQYEEPRGRFNRGQKAALAPGFRQQKRNHREATSRSPELYDVRKPQYQAENGELGSPFSVPKRARHEESYTRMTTNKFDDFSDEEELGQVFDRHRARNRSVAPPPQSQSRQRSKSAAPSPYAHWENEGDQQLPLNRPQIPARAPSVVPRFVDPNGSEDDSILLRKQRGQRELKHRDMLAKTSQQKSVDENSQPKNSLKTSHRPELKEESVKKGYESEGLFVLENPKANQNDDLPREDVNKNQRPANGVPQDKKPPSAQLPSATPIAQQRSYTLKGGMPEVIDLTSPEVPAQPQLTPPLKSIPMKERLASLGKPLVNRGRSRSKSMPPKAESVGPSPKTLKAKAPKKAPKAQAKFQIDFEQAELLRQQRAAAILVNKEIRADKEALEGAIFGEIVGESEEDKPKRIEEERLKAQRIRAQKEAERLAKEEVKRAATLEKERKLAEVAEKAQIEKERQQAEKKRARDAERKRREHEEERIKDEKRKNATEKIEADRKKAAEEAEAKKKEQELAEEKTQLKLAVQSAAKAKAEEAKKQAASLTTVKKHDRKAAEKAVFPLPGPALVADPIDSLFEEDEESLFVPENRLPTIKPIAALKKPGLVLDLAPNPIAAPKEPSPGLNSTPNPIATLKKPGPVPNSTPKGTAAKLDLQRDLVTIKSQEGVTIKKSQKSQEGADGSRLMLKDLKDRWSASLRQASQVPGPPEPKPVVERRLPATPKNLRAPPKPKNTPKSEMKVITVDKSKVLGSNVTQEPKAISEDKTKPLESYISLESKPAADKPMAIPASKANPQKSATTHKPKEVPAPQAKTPEVAEDDEELDGDWLVMELENAPEPEPKFNFPEPSLFQDTAFKEANRISEKSISPVVPPGFTKTSSTKRDVVVKPVFSYSKKPETNISTVLTLPVIPVRELQSSEPVKHTSRLISHEEVQSIEQNKVQEVKKRGRPPRLLNRKSDEEKEAKNLADKKKRDEAASQKKKQQLIEEVNARGFDSTTPLTRQSKYFPPSKPPSELVGDDDDDDEPTLEQIFRAEQRNDAQERLDAHQEQCGHIFSARPVAAALDESSEESEEDPDPEPAPRPSVTTPQVLGKTNKFIEAPIQRPNFVAQQNSIKNNKADEAELESDEDDEDVIESTQQPQTTKEMSVVPKHIFNQPPAPPFEMSAQTQNHMANSNDPNELINVYLVRQLHIIAGLQTPRRTVGIFSNSQKANDEVLKTLDTLKKAPHKGYTQSTDDNGLLNGEVVYSNIEGKESSDTIWIETQVRTAVEYPEFDRNKMERRFPLRTFNVVKNVKWREVDEETGHVTWRWDQPDFVGQHTNIKTANYEAEKTMAEFLKPPGARLNDVEQWRGQIVPALREEREVADREGRGFVAEIERDGGQIEWVPWWVCSVEVVGKEVKGPKN